MQSVFWDLLILMVVVWTAAVLLGRIGVPRIIGELLMGVILVLASLGLTLGVIDAETFSVLIFTAFLLSLITPAGLKGCATLLKRK